MVTDIEIVRDLRGFAGLGKEWNQLARRFASPLLEHEWFFTCAETLHPSSSLHVVLVRRDSDLVAAAPLVLVGGSHCDRLEVLGVSSLFEPSDFIYDSEASLLRLCRGLVELSLPIHVQRVPAEGAVARALVQAALGSGWLSCKPSGEALFFEWDKSWESFLTSRSSQRRYDLRRAQRRVDALGPGRFHMLAPEPNEVAELLSKAIAVEAAGWKGRAGSAIALKAPLRRFLMNYTRRAAERGELRLGFLEADSRLLAMEVAIESHGRYWILKIGYDERWKACSPGLLLLLEGMRAAQERGVRGHEFLGSDENWLRPWSTGARTFTSVKYYPRTIHGAQALVRDQFGRARSRWRALIRSSRA